MDMIGRIRRLHSRGKKSDREIVRLTGLSMNTISKWLRQPIEAAPKYHRSEGTTKLAPFHERLKLALKANGTYFAFRACPCRWILQRASRRDTVSNGCGLGRRFRIRGSMRPGRWPTLR